MRPLKVLVAMRHGLQSLGPMHHAATTLDPFLNRYRSRVMVSSIEKVYSIRQEHLQTIDKDLTYTPCSYTVHSTLEHTVVYILPTLSPIELSQSTTELPPAASPTHPAFPSIPFSKPTRLPMSTHRHVRRLLGRLRVRCRRHHNRQPS